MSESRTAIDVSAILMPPAEHPIDWRKLFGNEQPVELEVGSGKGLLLATAAQQNACHNFVGLEISRKYAKKCAERVAKRGVPNARVFCDDARRFLRDCVPAASLAALHVYFPDPWWKQRHRKRRVFDSEFVLLATKALMPAARLSLATDVEEYYGVMKALVAESASLQLVQSPSHDDPLVGPRTSFERKYRLEGRSIFTADYQKLGGPDRP